MTKPKANPSESDRAISDPADDHLGFAAIANKLTPSLIAATEGEGLVLGLEGPWGSGKSSLLNLIRREIEQLAEKQIHLIDVAPWLLGDNVSIANSLLSPIAAILETEAEKAASTKGKLEAARYQIGKTGELMRRYAATTGRALAPALKAVDGWIPGASIAGDVATVGANYMDDFGGTLTISGAKDKIVSQLLASQQRFIIFLDDLDRLEPRQAVEVVRLVRSVADFPHVVYVLCYDRGVLTHSLETALNLRDGDLFLQKIVQLTFSIPLPEPFDLRYSLFEGIIDFYATVHGEAPSEEEEKELRAAIDRQGSLLRTPRDVKLVLNGVKFYYPPVIGNVHFPDFCRLHIIKVTQLKLYRLLERYLGERSVVATGDGRVTEEEKRELGEELGRLLPSDDASSPYSIWHVRDLAPGVRVANKPEERVFDSVSLQENERHIKNKGVGSPFHYRYYFAFSPPKTVLPDEEFKELLEAARADPLKLAERLITLSETNRRTRRSWLDHIIDRLDQDTLKAPDLETNIGLIKAFGEIADRVIDSKEDETRFGSSLASRLSHVVYDQLRHLKTMHPDRFIAVALDLVENSSSPGWLIGSYFRDVLYNHGVVGSRAEPDSLHLFNRSEIEKMSATLNKRIQSLRRNNQIQEMPRLIYFMFGWRELSGPRSPRLWAKSYTKKDHDFLNFLLKMRSWTMSDRVYWPLNKSVVEAFLDWDQTTHRLQSIREGSSYEHLRQQAEVLTEAIKMGRD